VSVCAGVITQIWKVRKAEVEVAVICEDAAVEEVEEIEMILDTILVCVYKIRSLNYRNTVGRTFNVFTRMLHRIEASNARKRRR
jgi:ribosomal protein L30E